MNTIIVFAAKYLIFFSAAVAVVFLSRQPREKQKKILIFSAALLPLSYLIGLIARYAYFDPRPFVAQNFTPLFPHVADNGFPSDHTLLGAALALAVYHFNKKLGGLLFSFALLIGLARVLAGVHHSIDIFGSIAIVIIVYFVLWKIKKK